MPLEYLRNSPVLSEGEIEGVDLSRLLADFSDILEVSPDAPLSDNEQFMRAIELTFLLKNTRELTDINLYQSYVRFNTTTMIDNRNRPNTFERARYVQQLALLDRGLEDLRALIEQRLNVAKQQNLSLPRIAELCKTYKFTQKEADLFQLMVVTQGSQNCVILNSMLEEDYLRRMSSYQRICGMSEVDIDIFCDAERAHMKENLVTVDEENGTQFNLRVQKVAVMLFYGRKVKSDDLLKISQTSLEEIIYAELQQFQQQQKSTASDDDNGNANDNGNGAVVVKGQLSLNGKRKRQDLDNSRDSIDDFEGEDEEDDIDIDNNDEDNNNDDEVDDEDMDSDLRTPVLSRQNSYNSSSSNGVRGGARPIANKKSPRVARSGRFASPPKNSSLFSANNAVDAHHTASINHKSGPRLSWLEDVTADSNINVSNTANSSNNNSAALSEFVSEGADTAVGAASYRQQLDYLEDGFQLVALMIKGNAARMKDDLRKEGTAGRFGSSWGDGSSDMKHSKRELAAKLKLHESRIGSRLQSTQSQGLAMPRLEVLTTRLQLDSFEKRLLLLLIGKIVSPIVKTLIDTLDSSSSRIVEDSISVGQALSILCQDFHSQISHRKYFYQSSTLMKNAVISLSRPRWNSSGGGDLTENRIALDRRILDWTVGLDSEINELVEGSDLYEPQVDLQQVVLPHGHAERILSQCSAYDDFQKYRVQVGLEQQLTHGSSLVILLWGKSGTGKTMTVNAVAKQLGKRVLLVDFSSLLNKKNGGDLEVDLRGLFRESSMNNAVLFFDECETVFRSRALGADRTLNSLLTEIERHEGIVFMATNRPYEIDEAMHRRITMVLEYREPDSEMRKRIWDNILGISSNNCTRCEKSAVDESNKSSVEVSNKPESDTPAVVTTTSTCEAVKKGLVLSACVDTSVLSSKFQLTGGFIKNAVLSAMLSALARDRSSPVITQQDLLEGCRMQMRGDLTQRAQRDRLPSDRKIKDLHITENDRNVLHKIVRYENARTTVFGAWSFNNTNNNNNSTSSSSSLGSARSCQQRPCINLFAGNRGSGKATAVETIASELGDKRMKWMHVADLAGRSLEDFTDSFRTILKDASMMDSVVVLDGFEHMLHDPSEGPSADNKLHLMLSRLMDLLSEFHGCVFLIAHMENPQNINLHRDFSSALYSFVRFVMPTADIRSQIWKSLIPRSAPIAADVDFTALGRRFELFPGSIEAAIIHAATEVATRKVGNSRLTQKDLLAAGEYEIAKAKSGNYDMIAKLFS